MGSSKKDKITYGVTPTQDIAGRMLLDAARGGSRLQNEPYLGSFDITPDVLKGVAGAGDTTSWLTSVLGIPGATGTGETLEEMVKTGAPTDIGALLTQWAKVGGIDALRAGEQVSERARQAGSALGPVSRQAVGAATAEVAERGKLEASKMTAALLEAATQRRLQAAQLVTQIGTTAKQLGLDQARIELAANQFKAGMNYEEWKRMNPDVYQLAAAVWGKNVDTLVQQAPDQFGQFLSAIGPIIAAAIIAA